MKFTRRMLRKHGRSRMRNRSWKRTNHGKLAYKKRGFGRRKKHA